jgi:glycine/D-amino acid oxidase-like deaminating enzyme
MTVSVWQETVAAPEAVEHDVVVVGAGIIGAATAGLLAAAGRDVALVEKRFPAAGASGCNAGFVLMGMRWRYPEAIERFGRDTAREIWRLTDDNVHRMRIAAREHGVEMEETGATFLAIDAEEAGIMRDTVRLMQADGFLAEYADADPLDRGFAAAMLQPGDFGIQPAQLTPALARASGARLYDNDEVFDMRAEGAHLLVRSRRRLLRCGQAVLAVGGQAGLTHPYFQGLVQPIRNQVILTEPLPRLVETMGYAEHGFHYFRQLPDGRLLLGGGRHRFVEQETAYNDEITAPVQELLTSWLRRHFPETCQVGVSRRWAGVDGLTPDGIPIVGVLPDLPRAAFAVGFSGHGNSIGLVAAERLAELVRHGRDAGVLSARRLE